MGPFQNRELVWARNQPEHSKHDRQMSRCATELRGGLFRWAISALTIGSAQSRTSGDNAGMAAFGSRLGGLVVRERMAVMQYRWVNEQLRRTVGESLSIYQGTVEMLSIFLGFVFFVLVSLLLDQGPSTWPKTVAVFFLTIATIVLLFSLFAFHATAHRVVRRCQIFYPSSVFNRVGGPLLIAGAELMLGSIAVLLWNGRIGTCNATILTVCVSAAMVFLGLLMFFSAGPRTHRDRPYLINVDVDEVDRENK